MRFISDFEKSNVYHVGVAAHSSGTGSSPFLIFFWTSLGCMPSMVQPTAIMVPRTSKTVPERLVAMEGMHPKDVQKKIKKGELPVPEGARVQFAQVGGGFA